MQNRIKIHTKLRYTVKGTAVRPRLAVYRGINNVYAQLINDEKGVTIASANSLKLKGSLSNKAKEVGTEIAKQAKEAKIKAVVFDRGGFSYKGVVKTFYETARVTRLTT